MTTELTYDGLGRCVGIRRTEAGTVTSDRRFLWSGTQIHAERTAAGVTVKRFFDQGFQTVSAMTADFFYSCDHLGSIREVIDGEGTVRCRYAYDPFGRRSRVSGDVEADYGFAGCSHCHRC